MEKKYMTVNDVIHFYELKLQSLQTNFPERERWGHGPHDKHEIAIVQEFLGVLYIVAKGGSK